MFERITVDPEIHHGQPCIRGMRIPVHLIVDMVAGGMLFDEILEAYPDLEKEDITSALEYAAYLTKEMIVPLRIEIA